MEQEIPEKVWLVGKARPMATHHAPIKAGGGEGLAPLTVLDPDGERALPVFTTRYKAERGIEHFMSEAERGFRAPTLSRRSERNHIGSTSILYRTFTVLLPY